MLAHWNCATRRFSSTYFHTTHPTFGFSPLPNNNFFDWSKLKELADDKMTVNKNLIFVSGRTENIVEKGENAGYQHFLLFLQCFQKASFPGLSKVGIVWKTVKNQMNHLEACAFDCHNCHK